MKKRLIATSVYVGIILIIISSISLYSNIPIIDIIKYPLGFFPFGQSDEQDFGEYFVFGLYLVVIVWFFYITGITNALFSGCCNYCESYKKGECNNFGCILIGTVVASFASILIWPAWIIPLAIGFIYLLILFVKMLSK